MKISSQVTQPTARNKQRPVWLRINDCRSVYGITRGVAYRLIAQGELITACVRSKGSRRGIRLIQVESLERFIQANLVVQRKIPDEPTEVENPEPPPSARVATIPHFS